MSLGLTRTLPLVAVALAALAATPTSACSIGRMRPVELRAEQRRDLEAADLIFLARVVNHGVTDQSDLNVVLFEPLEPISGELPGTLSVAVFYCLPLPPVGETQVILMRASDLSGTPDRTSPVLGYYDVSDIQQPVLRGRVDRALQRANIE